MTKKEFLKQHKIRIKPELIKEKVSCPLSDKVFYQRGWLNNCPKQFVHPSSCYCCEAKQRPSH